MPGPSPEREFLLPPGFGRTAASPPTKESSGTPRRRWNVPTEEAPDKKARAGRRDRSSHAIFRRDAARGGVDAFERVVGVDSRSFRSGRKTIRTPFPRGRREFVPSTLERGRKGSGRRRSLRPFGGHRGQRILVSTRTRSRRPSKSSGRFSAGIPSGSDVALVERVRTLFSVSFGPAGKPLSRQCPTGCPKRFVFRARSGNGGAAGGDIRAGVGERIRARPSARTKKESRWSGDVGFRRRRRRHRSRPHRAEFRRRRRVGSIACFGPVDRSLGRRSGGRRPNVCVDRKEIDDGAPKNRSFAFNFQSTSCKETDTSYTCTKKIETNEESKTFVVKRQCCYGYRRRGSECVEFELKELAEVMKDLGASRFVKMLSSVDLLEKLREGNFTVFCPVDDAVTDFEEEDEDNNIPSSRVVRSTDTATVVAGHVVEGYVTSDDFRGNRVLPTLNEKTGIRLNAYSGLARRPFVLPNCAKILGANNYATNGVVHLVDRILPAPTDSVLDIVAKNSQLTVMKGLLSQAGMVEKLSNPEETYTIFAPVDSAFKRMGSELLKKMQKGEGCVTSVVESHISPHVVCSSAVVNVGYVSNLLNGELKLTRDENDKLFVDDVQIVAHDMVGTNGVVHIVEEVLIPDSARTLTETLQRADRSDLVDLIEVAGIREELDTLRNFTFFAPSRNSLKKLLTEESEEFRNNSEKSKELITSHVASTTVKSCDFRNDLILPSLWEDATFRVNRFDVIPGFVHHFTLQCVPILNINLGVCEGAIHVLYQTVSPSKSKIVETLEGRKDLSTFVRLLKESGLAQTLEEDGPFTVLAPDNDAFDNTKDKDVLEDKDKLLDLLKLHILPETLCCSGIRSSAGLSIRRLVTTLNGSEIPVRRSYKGVKFSSSKVVGCDLMAKNGVIHVVNKVVHPSRSHALDFSELVREMFSI